MLDTKINDLTPNQMLQVQHAIGRREGSVAGDTLTFDNSRLPDAVRSAL